MGALSVNVNLIERNGRILVTSLEVAERFGKRHDNVLAAVRDLECSDEFRLLNFKEQEYFNERGHSHPMYEMTRDGFVFLVRGFTGKVAAVWWEKFIEAFNTMEAALEDGQSALMVIATAIDRLSENQTTALGLARSLDTGQKEILEDVAEIKGRVIVLEKHQSNKPKRISDKVKFEHLGANAQMGGKCQSCGVRNVLNSDGTKGTHAEFDHFFQNSKADEGHTWLICRQCHDLLSPTRPGPTIDRAERLNEFQAYQDRRKRLPGRQPRINGL